MSASADDQYEQQNDVVGGDVPAGDSKDNDYSSRTGQSQIPVQKDDVPVTDPIDPATADSDQVLGMLFSLFQRLGPLVIMCPDVVLEQDEKDAIDPSNTVGSRTRGAKPSGGYREPGDEEGLPGPDDGTSRVSYPS